jgi:alanine racemase
MKTSRPIRARISPAAIAHNYQRAKSLAGQAKAWAVIKANAYGHGQWRALEALRVLADGFAMLETENAVALREAGVQQPILLLEGIFSARDARAVAAYGLTSVVHCQLQLDLLLAAMVPDKPFAVYVKLNTGMNRLGFRAEELPAVLQQLAAWTLAEVTLMTHFAEADGGLGIAAQLSRFEAMSTNWPGACCLANSAAIFDYPATHADWVRPGIMLYGASPFADRTAAQLGLQTTMTLESAIIGTQTLAAGDRVGYGGTFVAEQPMRIGIVACGYADGYPRHAPTGTPIAVMGQLTRTLGRVSMDMLMCDLTALPEADIGSPVTLWGKGVAGEVPVDAVAAAAGTIAYELFCALAPRVPVEVGEI